MDECEKCKKLSIKTYSHARIVEENEDRRWQWSYFCEWCLNGLRREQAEKTYAEKE